MKKRVLSAILVLCMACGLVSTAWATDEVQAAPTPEPTAQTVTVDPVEATVATDENAATPAPGEGEESEPPEETPAATEDPAAAEEPDASPAPGEEPTPSPEPAPSQPNRAPAAAPGTAANSDNDIELYAEPGAGEYTFQVTWKPDFYSSGANDEYVQVILYDTESKNTISISGNDFDAWLNSHTQMNNGTTWNISQDHPDIDGYHFSGAEYWRTNDNNGAENAKSLNQVQANHERRSIDGSKRWYYYVDNGNRFEISENRLVIRLKYTPDEPDDPTPQGDFYIDDKIIQAGTLVPQFSDPNSENAKKAVSYKWYRSDSENGSYTEVTRRKVTLDSYNVTETGDALYPSFDGGARQWYYVEAYDAEGTLLDTSPKFQVPLYDALQNGSFETPKLKDYGQRDPNPQSGEEGIVWKTTADDNEIELIRVDKDISGWWWDDPKNSDTWDVYGLYDTADGDQVAELNANSAGALYQDVLTVPGSTLTWELSHRARNRGNSDSYTGDDTMYVIIMSTVRAEDYTTQAQIEQLVSQHQSELDRDNYYYDASTGIAIWKLTDGAMWVEHSDTYVVPSNQHATRFFFAAGHTAFDDEYPNETKLKNTVGNFIDDVSFDDQIPLPNDDEINLTLSKTVVGLTDEELADYTVDITVQGIEGTEYSNTVQFNAENFIFNDDESSATATRPIQIKLPANAGTQTYKISESVSGLVDGKEATSSTVAVNDGASEEGTSTTISASGGHSYTIAFTNTYTTTTTDLTITKTFVGLDEEKANQVWDALGFTVASNGSTLTPAINKANDVTASGNTFTATATIKGLTIGETYTVTETNADLTGYTRTTTVSGTDVTNSNDGSADVKIASNSNVTFTNTYTRDKGILTIQKRVKGLLSGDSASDVTFMVTITGPADAAGVTFKDANGDDRTFVASGNGASVDNVAVEPGTNVTIAELPTDHYTITEVQPSAATPNSNYEILNGKYYFVKAVDDGKDEVDLGKDGETATITNNYAPYYSVTIEKQVGGEMGSGEDWFDFTVSPKENGSLPEGMTITSTNPDVPARIQGNTFQLKAGATVTIGHLKANDAIVVTEAASQSGYKTTINTNGCIGASIHENGGTDGVTTIEVPNTDVTTADLGKVIYINTREAVAPTGLESDHTAPFALMVTAAGIAGLALIGAIVNRRIRRRREE